MLFNIEPYERKIFSLISEAAEELDFPTYVVGGFVRDRLLGRTSKDIDVVCVGSGIELATKLSEKLRPAPRLVVFPTFRHCNVEAQGARN